MDSFKLHTKERLVEYKEAVSDSVDKLVEELKARVEHTFDNVRDSLSHPDRLIDGFAERMDRLFSKQTANLIKELIETDAAYLVGYKDQMMGGMKEAAGHVLRDDQLLRAGRRQLTQGRKEVDLQKSLAFEKRYQKERARIVQTLLHRESLMNQVVFAGGFEKYRAGMRHVEMPSEELGTQAVFDLFRSGGQSFKLKTYDVRPLLEDIRNRNTRKPMKYVEPREKGLLRSVPLKKRDMRPGQAVTRSNLQLELCAAIRRSDVSRLHPVPFGKVLDRSAPRLDLYHSLRVSSECRTAVLREVTSGEHKKELIHVMKVEDKASPAAFIEKNGFDGLHKQLLDEQKAKSGYVDASLHTEATHL